MTREKRRRPNADRDMAIVALRMKGLKLREIAEAHGISVERVRQICHRAKWLETRAQK
jgi:DNA-directed RNA polymerase specialized sigma24 family protein